MNTFVNPIFASLLVLVLVVPGCLDTLEGTVSPSAVADSNGSLDVTPGQDTGPDIAVADANTETALDAETDGQDQGPDTPTDATPPPIAGGEIEFVGLSATQDRLFYLTDKTELVNALQNDPAHYTLWSLNLDTDQATQVADRVLRHTERGTTLVWSQDGRTLTFGRLDESADTLAANMHWLLRVYADVFVWREGEGVISALGKTSGVPMLAPEGSAVSFVPSNEGDVPHHRSLDTAALTSASNVDDVSWSTSEFLHHRPSGTLLMRLKDAANSLVALDVETGNEVTVAEDADLLGLEGGFALYTVGGLLAAYDLDIGVSYVSSLEVVGPQSVFFDLDAKAGIAVAGLGTGVYGNVFTWDLASGAGYEIPMPEANNPGAQTLALNARIQGGGIAYLARPGWQDKDLWQVRGDQHHHIASNVCTDMALPGRSDRLLLTSEAGCSTAGPKRAWLYDPESMVMSDAGFDVKYVRGVLSDGRVVFDIPLGPNHADGRELTLWDIDADSLTPLAVEATFNSHRRRDGDWYLARYSEDGGGDYVLVHPGGIATGSLGDVPDVPMTTGEDVIVYVDRAPEGDTIVTTSWEALVNP